MDRTSEEIPFSHPVAVATLHGETHLKLEPDAAARVAIARFLDLDGVERLTTHFVVTHANNGLVTVAGTIEGLVRPVCVLSLEPFDQAIDEKVELRFAPEALVEKMTKRAEENEDEDFEPPDVIENGAIDFGALTTEFLALSLDPYPKKPGAAFKGAGDPPPPRISPFDALKALKKEGET